MTYDDDLADRVRAAILDPDGLTERRMFGGHAFLVNGNLAVSASGQGGLLLRVDPGQTDSLVRDDGVTRFEMRGRSMNGWLHVAASAAATDEQLQQWVEIGLNYARSLPSK
ncbi:MAG: TfoX/Sxy family protein [Marmoricola sp.]